MSNNVRGKKDPFNGPLSAKSQKVGNNYGDRRGLMKIKNNTSVGKPQAPVRDKYSAQKKKAKNLEAHKLRQDRYRAAGRLSREKPYKPKVLDRVEEGVTSQSREITDSMRLDFLDKIINTKELHSSTTIRKAIAAKSNQARKTRQMGKPAVPSASKTSGKDS